MIQYKININPSCFQVPNDAVKKCTNFMDVSGKDFYVPEKDPEREKFMANVNRKAKEEK
jgi:hypothetical protein